MKTTILTAALLFLSCCANSKVIDGKTVVPYGLFNTEDRRDDIAYEISTGNLFWSFIGFETAVVPGYLIGWRLYEPVGKK